MKGANIYYSKWEFGNYHITSYVVSTPLSPTL